MIRPYNLKETIETAIEALGYTDEILDRPFIIEARDHLTKLPPQWLIGGCFLGNFFITLLLSETTTLRICFERFFDLQTVPKKSFFEILATLSDDPMEKEKLLELSNPKFIVGFSFS